MAAQALSLVVGLWVYVSPAVLGVEGRAATAAYVLGALAASISFLAIFDILRGLRYGNVAAGILLAAAPAVFGFGGRGLVSALVSAVALVGLALAARPGDLSGRGGGWRRVLRSSVELR